MVPPGVRKNLLPFALSGVVWSLGWKKGDSGYSDGISYSDCCFDPYVYYTDGDVGECDQTVTEAIVFTVFNHSSLMGLYL